MTETKNLNAGAMTDEEEEALVLNLYGKMSISNISKHTGFSIPFVNTIIRRAIKTNPELAKRHRQVEKPKPPIKEYKRKTQRKTVTLHSRAETPQMTYEEVLAYRKYKYLPWCGVAYFDENTDRLPIGDERRMQAEYDVLFLNRHSGSNRNDKFLI